MAGSLSNEQVMQAACFTLPPTMKFRLFLLTVLLTSTATAQTPAPVEPAPPPQAAPSKPPTDPYVKKKSGEPKPGTPTGAGASVHASSEQPPHHLLMTFETYRLSQSALDTLLEQPGAHAGMYDGVRKLVSAGEAALENVVAVPTRSGQVAAVESHDELLFAIEFDPPSAAISYSFPTAYEMRPLGDRLEVDPVAQPDGVTVDLNFVQQEVRLIGYRLSIAGERSEGELLPVIASRKLQTALSFRVGEPTFCGTMNTPLGTGVEGADGDGSVSVTFVRTSRCAVKASKGEAPQLKMEGQNLHTVFRFYSLPREKARDLLAATSDADQLKSRLTALPAQEVKLERLLTTVTKSGNRVQTEEAAEWLYMTEVNLPSFGMSARQSLPDGVEAAPDAGGAPVEQEAKGGPKFFPASGTAMEIRNVGWQVEMEPILAPDAQYVEVNLAPSYTQYRGDLQGHPMMAKYPRWPLFCSQKVTTAVTAPVGKQCFLGTMNPPRDTGANGRKDDGRVWFAFMKVTLE
jgi:hypothetical protein